MKALKPIVEKVFAIRQNTPTGATLITIIVISIIISLPWLKRELTVSAESPSLASITPKTKAKNITWSIDASDKPLNIFVGIISKIVSTKLSLSALFDATEPAVEALCWTALISRPIPGLIKLPIHKATVMAIAVVAI